jgi:hypothetical protein
MHPPSVDIYTTAAGGYDIVILNTGQYQSQTTFEFITRYVTNRGKLDVAEAGQCAAYYGIAMRLKGFLADRDAAKKELYGLLLEALQLID